MTSRDNQASYYDLELPDGTRTEVWSVLRAVLTAEESLGYAKGCILARVMRDGRKDVDRLREAEKVGVEAGMLREAMGAYLATPDPLTAALDAVDSHDTSAGSLAHDIAAILQFREGHRFVDEAARVAAHIAELERERDEARAKASVARATKQSMLERMPVEFLIDKTLTASERVQAMVDQMTALKVDVERRKNELDDARTLLQNARAQRDSYRDTLDTERQAAVATAEELERVRKDLADERGWNDKRRDMYERLGRALDPLREKRYSGEPARDDATEVEAACRELAALRDRYRPRRQSEEPAPRDEVVHVWDTRVNRWMTWPGERVPDDATWTHQPPAPGEGEA